MNQRFYSLDVFRGATVCLMILVNNPGSWSHIFGPLKHAPWHGLTPTDLVFPFFLFAVGNAMAFVMPRLVAGGDRVFWKKVIKRTLLIFGIGLFLNWWPFFRWVNGELVFNQWTYLNSSGKLVGVRILGVLQRIALCYFFASIIIYYLKARGAFITGMVMLLIYWLICYAGNPTDPYSLQGWFGTEIDLAILNDPHMYHGEWLNGKPYAFDPEGLISTLPATVQVILGYLAGNYIFQKNRNKAANTNFSDPGNSIYRTVTVLFVAAMAFLFAGYVWGLHFPVNKKIWTSSYVVLTTGMAIAILATLIYAIEIKGWKGWWSRFFDVFGKNALFVFALSAFLPKGLRLIRIPDGMNNQGEQVFISPWNWLYLKIYKFIPGPPEIGSLAFALTVIFFMWAICYWMDRKKIYVKV